MGQGNNRSSYFNLWHHIIYKAMPGDSLENPSTARVAQVSPEPQSPNSITSSGLHI